MFVELVLLQTARTLTGTFLLISIGIGSQGEVLAHTECISVILTRILTLG